MSDTEEDNLDAEVEQEDNDEFDEEVDDADDSDNYPLDDDDIYALPPPKTSSAPTPTTSTSTSTSSSKPSSVAPPTMQPSLASMASSSATRRLAKDLQALVELDPSIGFKASPLNDNLYDWSVQLYFNPGDGAIAEDLDAYKKKYGVGHVDISVKFPPDYPFAPPFIRVVRPRFKQYTGHVTIGGSICMELLTRSGWFPTQTLELVLVQIRSEMLVGGGRIDFTNGSAYDEHEARMAFARVAKQHGWE